MAKAAGPRLVQCYLCGHRFEVSGRAQSTSCPGCNRAVRVADETLGTGKRRGPIRELRTCGRIVIGKRARLICEHVEAHGGLECLGILDARDVVLGGGGLRLGPKAEFKGELHAPSVEMEAGARVHPSPFAVPSDPRGLTDPAGGKPAPKTRPGTSGAAPGEAAEAEIDPLTGKKPPKVARTRGHRPG
ncbi:polymer-forming cytoskeletal protein [Phycisphaera mikurensis]|uniref:polymer-forming cytoskeletal protein n=1 Tax=Phycisphaera mikurensis TaxID=547188 RepID=UPI0012B61371|nr:polymer-forming cytoskeletal protein [Phycisphaera mikurensis]MBB6442987.1 hypothetical protein [Phycisphaera mikurensis]